MSDGHLSDTRRIESSSGNYICQCIHNKELLANLSVLEENYRLCREACDIEESSVSAGGGFAGGFLLPEWLKTKKGGIATGRFLQGYEAAFGQQLSKEKHSMLPSAIGALYFELGLRYYTDYLCGGTYFTGMTQEERLARALRNLASVKSACICKKYMLKYLTDGGKGKE